MLAPLLQAAAFKPLLEVRMFVRKSVLLAAVVAGATLSPIASAARVDVYIAPPAPIYEPVPVPRVGYVWAPGYWEYRDNDRHHHWIQGHWIHERRGYAWVPHRWEEHDGRWHSQDGHWERHG